MADNTFKDILDFSIQHNALLRYPDSTDFKAVTRGAAQNEMWRDTTSETLWTILSSCGKDINNIVSNAAINYVQNLADVNTARIPALVSMGNMLKYETGSLLEIYNIMPSGLQLLLDILSIDREYLFGGESPILSVPLVRKLMEKMKVGLMRLIGRDYLEEMALEDVFTEVKRNSHRVDEEAYYALIKELFYELILDVLTARYSESDDATLIDNLLYAELNSYERQDAIPRNTVLDKMIRGESRHPLDLEGTSGSSISLDPSIRVNEGESYSSLADQIEALRRTYNVSHSFNPWVIADQINEHGFSPGNELTDNEKILVETVLNAHNKERFDYAAGHYMLGKIDSRYGYYREKEFVKYLKAFLILHSLKVQAVNLDVTTLNLVGINVVTKQDTCVLDLFTYVNKKWLYDPEQPADKEIPVDQYGIGKAIILKPVGTDTGKAFIPRVRGDMENTVIETRGYDYIETYQPTAKVTWKRSIDLENRKPTDILDVIADKLAELVFKIHAMRNEMKRQAQFNAMRGTGSLLAHSINDFLLTKYPTEQFDVIPRWSSKKSYADRIKDITNDSSIDELERLRLLAELQALITENIKLFRNYTNVDIIEYMDTTEYYNIHPTGLYTNDEVLLDSRYWEQLSKAITNRDKAQLGVFSPNEIREFYRNKLSMGSLHSSTEVEDDIEEFLLSLYETGATDTYYDEETGNLIHPINDVTNEDNLFAYESKSDRMKVQDNEELIAKQDKQFLRYSSNTDMLGENRNRNGNGQVIEAFNWKNTKYASVMLHPFMYTFQLWNPLVNILINAMSEYITSDLERNLTNKKIFDELYGKDGESRDFWKYNVLDFTGYVTRYEHERHDKVDAVGETSPLTGYDGLFYPSAIKEFLDAYNRTKWEMDRFAIDGGTDKGKNLRAVRDFTPRYTYKPYDQYGASIFISNDEFEHEKVEAERRVDAYENMAYLGDPASDYGKEYGAPDLGETFEQVIASIYWQIEFKRKDGQDVSKIGDLHTADYMTYYGRWFAHLGYSDERCKRIAKQLWYWRDRIVDAATHRYAVCNYNLDLGNNSMLLMDTFTDELKGKELLGGGDQEERNYAIEALDASLIATNNFIERSINENHNTTAGRCFTPSNRPKELWIRWNAEPLALPAFDVYWDNEQLPDRWYDESDPTNKRTSLGSAGRFQEFGQIKYKDSTTNDAISDVIENFLQSYTLDGSGVNTQRGNKAPIFYSFQQNADVLIFAAWSRRTDENSMLSGYDRSALCPIHILCRETQTSDGEYLFERFLQDTPTIDPIGKLPSDCHLSAPYIFDATGGNILLPTYRIVTPRASDDGERASDAENETVLSGQCILIKLYGLSCQSIVKSNYETREKLVIYDERSIFLNADNLFSGTVLISNGTSVLFSLDGERLGLAFLGNLTSKALDIVSKTLGGGCTRYLADSDPQEKIALLRKRFYEVKGEHDDELPDKTVGTYADLRISDDERNIWNSFDRNDKFVCVVQYDGALDPGTWALEAKNSTKFSSRLLNLVSDASYIPEFAYQSPKDFDRFPEVSGTTYLHQATYFGLKDHWAIQLLGLENNLMLDFVKVAQNLVVHDETDNVDTYVNPGQLVDAIYRIWEQSEMTDYNLGIERLYNPKMIFDPVTKVATWSEWWVVNEEGKEAFLNRHLSLVRCNENKGGEILNEKNWVLKIITIKEIVDDLSRQNPEGDGFRRVSLDDFYTVALENEGHSCKSTSHILVGTQDPYKYSADPDWATTLRSPAYLLQYGNGIAGARRCEVGVFIDKRREDEVLPEGATDYPSREDAPYLIRIEVKLFKEDADVQARETPEITTYMDSVDVIPPKCLLMAISQDEVERLADYHMLIHHDDIFYNVPDNDKDDILRADLVPNVEEPTHFICPKCGCVYDESKGSPWAIPEQTSISSNVLSAAFIKPTPSSIKCVWEVKDFQQGTDPATLYLEYGTSQGTYEVTKKIATCTNGLVGDITIHALHSDTVYYARLRLTQGEGEDSTDIDTATGSFTTAKPDIPAGTKFADVPADWKCPKCKTAKSEFKPLVDPEHTGIAEDQNRPRLPADKPARNFLDYLYIYEGSAAFKINEQSDKFCTFNWEHPNSELDKLLYNFRKNQVDLNCLYPWSTYVTQEHNPKLPHVSSVEMETVTGTDCRGVEEFNQEILPIGNLITDVSSRPGIYDIAIWIDSTGSMSCITNLRAGIVGLCEKIFAANPQNRVAIIQFRDSRYNCTNAAILDFTNDKNAIINHVNNRLHPFYVWNEETQKWEKKDEWNDESAWSIRKLFDTPLHPYNWNTSGFDTNTTTLSWRNGSFKTVIAITDETSGCYHALAGHLAIPTINGAELTNADQLDSADWEYRSLKRNPEIGTAIDWEFNQGYYTTGANPGDILGPRGEHAGNRPNSTVYNEDEVSIDKLVEAFNAHNASLYWLGVGSPSKTDYKGIYWHHAYMNRIQRLIIDKLQARGGSSFCSAGNLVPSLKNIVDKCLVASPIWEYDVQPGDSTADILNKMIDAGYMIHTWEAAGNNETGGGTIKSIDVSGEDFDSTYKIYANYQKVEDSDDPRGYHFDLFFNIQNLFKPPFEYMSKVTHQPAPHILPHSYLYLPGDKNSRLEERGGKLTLYAQMKWLVNDITAAVKTLPLVTYDIYNISDDKPKFFIKRTKDLERARPTVPTIFLKFEDVYIDGSQLVDEQGITTEAVDVVQALSVHYNNDISSEFNRLSSLKFNIVQNDSVPVIATNSESPPFIDLDKTRTFFSYPPNNALAIQGAKDRSYPERFNATYSTIGTERRGYSVAYTYQDAGYTNEDLYLYWTIPAGLNVVRAIQTIGCVVEDTAIKCVAKMRSGDEAPVIAQPGHIYINSRAGNAKYLGREHGKHLNKFGYVLTKVSSTIKNRKVRLK